MARSDPQFNIRVPKELKEQIEFCAKENGRSVTQEVVQTLSERYLPKKRHVSLTQDELQRLSDILNSLKE